MIKEKPVPTTRALPSWIGSYLDFVQDTAAPKNFQLWSAIATIGLALERRVWVHTARITYPNLFIFLVARPGVGKSIALEPAIDLLQETGTFSLLPKDLTGSALLDVLARERFRKRLSDPTGQIKIEYHSAGMFITELGTMIRDHDLPFLSMLSEIWDCPPNYVQERRHMKDDPIRIPHPQLTLLAGTQPGYLASIFPTEAWSQGFMSRVIMIHSAEPSKPKLFGGKRLDGKLRQSLVNDLAALSKLEGELIFSEEAALALETWYENGELPRPQAHRLEGYNTRRIVNLQKLCIIARASRRDKGLTIEFEDFELALTWLLEAEQNMEHIFLEMKGRSDIDVIRDLHTYAWNEYMANKKKPVSKAKLMAFLSVRVPAFQALKILETCEQTGLLERVAGTEDQFIPQPRSNQGPKED